MKTVKDVFRQYQQALTGTYSYQEIDAITSLILTDLLHTSKAELKAFPETEIAHQHAERLVNILIELKTGRPIQYILGHTEFYGLTFNVTPSVLIPRPETEELVQWVINTVKVSATPIKNILDIGTGSGCIAITLKKNLSEVNVFAIDISSDALQIAKANAKLNNADVNFIKANILNYNSITPLPDFDIIVSNPPYVTETDRAKMHHNVIRFEPHLALFVPENEPLIFYNAIAGFAKEHLTDNGLLFFEVNENYGNEAVEMLQRQSFDKIELEKDMFNKDRMIKASVTK